MNNETTKLPYGLYSVEKRRELRSYGALEPLGREFSTKEGGMNALRTARGPVVLVDQRDGTTFSNNDLED